MRKQRMDNSSHRCIECGNTVSCLYHDYKAGIIKMSHCGKCNAVADKYVEYDSVLILLDTLLLRFQAYRHLLFNTDFKSPWRSVLLLWFCDAFIKLIQRRTDEDNSVSIPLLSHELVGTELYINYLAAACELLCFMTCVLLILAVKSLILHHSLKSFDSTLIIKAIVIGNLGRIFAMPALLWGQSYSSAYVWLCQGFICLSSLQALRVCTPSPYRDLFALLAVCLAAVSQFVLPLWISNALSSILL